MRFAIRNVHTGAGAVTALTAGVVVSLGLVAPAQAQTARSASPLDAGSRQAVTQAYQSMWAPASRTPLDLSGGDPSSCTPYRSSDATQARTKNAINFARELAGMRPISTVNDSHAGAAGVSALLQASNQTLSHTPPSNWRCWSLTGATAAGRSNLDLRWSTGSDYLPTVSDVVGDYLVDRGSNNVEVGHRRWLLRPQTTSMGSGNALVTADGARYVTNALWVVPSILDRTPAGTPTFYGWPSAGWFPAPMEPEGRWSVSSSIGSSFARATVRVTHDGVSVPVTVRPYAIGYADNTLVWDLDQPAEPSGGGVERYDVTVSGITGAGPSSYSYSVRLFDPSWSDPAWPASTASTRIATRPTSIGLRATHRVHRHDHARLHVGVRAEGTPTGRFVVRVDGRRIGAWHLHDGHRTVRLPALHRLGRHHVVVHYAHHRGWSASTARATVRVVR